MSTDEDRTANNPDNTEGPTPRRLTIDTAIVGVRFYTGAAERLADLYSDQAITLIREPDNKFDHNAIAVHVGDDNMKCGHIPAPQAKFLAPLLDAGATILDIKRRGVTGLILTIEKAEAVADEPPLKPDELGD